MSNQSGWYQTKQGDAFHISGQDMDDSTIEALRNMAAAAITMVQNGKHGYGDHVWWRIQTREHGRFTVQAKEKPSEQIEIALLNEYEQPAWMLEVGTFTILDHPVTSAEADAWMHEDPVSRARE